MTNVEPLRPAPDFRVYVERGKYRADVTDAVIDAYDVAVGSLDFGSGFLSTEQVDNLRHLGNAIGAEPFNYATDACRCGHQFNWHHGHRGCASMKCRCGGYQEVSR